MGPNNTNIVVDNGSPSGVSFFNISKWSTDSAGTLHIYQRWEAPDGRTGGDDLEIASYPRHGWHDVLLNACANRACSCQGAEPLKHDAFSATEPQPDAPAPETSAPTGCSCGDPDQHPVAAH